MRARQADASIRPSLLASSPRPCSLSRLSGWRFISTYAARDVRGFRVAAAYPLRMSRRLSLPVLVAAIAPGRPCRNIPSRLPKNQMPLYSRILTILSVLARARGTLLQPGSRETPQWWSLRPSRALVLAVALGMRGRRPMATTLLHSQLNQVLLRRGLRFGWSWLQCAENRQETGRLLARHPTACQVLSLQSCDWPEQQSRGDNRQSSSMKMPKTYLTFHRFIGIESACRTFFIYIDFFENV